MAKMSYQEFVRHRANCEFHSARRSDERGLGMSAEDIVELSSLVDRAREAFVYPGATRYWIRVRRHNGQRIKVIFDTELSTIVTVVGG